MKVPPSNCDVAEAESYQPIPMVSVFEANNLTIFEATLHALAPENLQTRPTVTSRSHLNNPSSPLACLSTLAASVRFNAAHQVPPEIKSEINWKESHDRRTSQSVPFPSRHLDEQVIDRAANTNNDVSDRFVDHLLTFKRLNNKELHKHEAEANKTPLN